jgi:hypothetical protein
MVKYKAPKGKPRPSSTRGLIPCLLLIVSGIALMSLFFYLMLKGAGG